MARIRPSSAGEQTALTALHARAFGEPEGDEIAALVGDLFHDVTARPLLSLVAEVDDTLAGHVLFSAAHVGPERRAAARILAPLAVLPGYRDRGLGSALVREGLADLARSGVALVFVLGHPAYYPRFGFRPAGPLGLAAPYPIPARHEGAWMVLALEPGIIGNIRGRVSCAQVLDEPRHWQE